MLKILICGKLCRLPTSKSLKSCAGVILTAPEPFSGIGIFVGDDRNLPPDQRQDHVLADQLSCSAHRPGCTATAVSPSMVSGRVVATTIKVEGSSD